MQTPDQIHAKITALFEKAPVFIHDEVEHILQSGAINLEDASDDYRWPKLIYVAVLRRLADEYHPGRWDLQGQEELENIGRF